jgi:hypothetical protein
MCASNRAAADDLFSKMNPAKSSLVKIDCAGDALLGAPDKVAKSMLLFVQGLGLLTTATVYPGGLVDMNKNVAFLKM